MCLQGGVCCVLPNAAGFEEVSGGGLGSALLRRQGVEGFLDIHTSRGLGVVHVTGPLTPLDRTSLTSNTLQRHTKPTLNACQLVSVEQGQGIAVGLDVTRELQGEYAYIQVGMLDRMKVGLTWYRLAQDSLAWRQLIASVCT